MRAGEKILSSQKTGKLLIFLVGLPGRGKTFIGHILARHVRIFSFSCLYYSPSN